MARRPSDKNDSRVHTFNVVLISILMRCAWLVADQRVRHCIRNYLHAGMNDKESLQQRWYISKKRITSTFSNSEFPPNFQLLIFSNVCCKLIVTISYNQILCIAQMRSTWTKLRLSTGQKATPISCWHSTIAGWFYDYENRSQTTNWRQVGIFFRLFFVYIYSLFLHF